MTECITASAPSRSNAVIFMQRRNGLFEVFMNGCIIGSPLKNRTNEIIYSIGGSEWTL
jgi:hypothetical protein